MASLVVSPFGQVRPFCRGLLHQTPLATRLSHETLRRRDCQRERVKRVAKTSVKVFPFDQAWGPSIDQASLAPQIFALSLFPYLAFLYFLTRSNKAPPLTLFGFYFLLVFVGVSIPAGIYGSPFLPGIADVRVMSVAKSHYGTSLSNVDWLHGGAEIFLSITNLLIVVGLRQGIREAEEERTRDEEVEEECPEDVIDETVRLP